MVMERTKWIDRKFTFDSPTGWLPNIIERLLGTAVRLNALTSDVNDVVAARNPEGKWSIKEHIGHLIDLEELHAGRLSDLIAGRPELRAADMTNKKTHEAAHNTRGLQRLINDFNRERRIFVDMLKALDEDVQQRSAIHPRLNTKMRPVDVAYFTAEHDDHHLATIRELVLQFRK
jgi:hypothetical protein